MMELWKSKKFKVMLAAVVSLIGAGIAGEILWADVIKLNIGTVVAYILAVGATDIGKGKVEAEKKQ